MIYANAIITVILASVGFHVQLSQQNTNAHPYPVLYDDVIFNEGNR